jgi:hypothetical protein
MVIDILFLCYDSMPKELGLDLFDYQFSRQYDDDGNPVDEPCTLTIYRKPKSEQ